MQDLWELTRKCRSYRRFDGSKPMDEETMKRLVDLGRLAASGGNLQPLKYLLSCEAKKNADIYNTLTWAGYLTDWDGPEPQERPTGYIVIIHDKKITPISDCDHGIAAQNIMLGAVSLGLGGCMIKAIHHDKLRQALNLPSYYDIPLVLALGTPKEEVIIDEIENKESIKYWRDKEKNHHVPKRKLDDILL